MKKIHIHSVASFLIILGLFALALPAATGQTEGPPEWSHRVGGQATINEEPVAPGTLVEVRSGGETIASDNTDSDGIYYVDIEPDYDDDEVSFYLRGHDTGERLTVSSGDVDNLNIGITDQDPPEIDLRSPEDGLLTDQEEAIVEGSIEDNLSVPEEISVTISGEEATLMENGEFYLEKSLESGQNTIEVVAEDLVGNSSSENVTITSDSQPPTLDVSYSEIVDRKTATIEGTVSDDVTDIEDMDVTLDGNTLELDSEGNFSKDESLTQGSNSFTIEATDNVGNSVSENITIVSDTVPPKVSINSPASEKVVDRGTDTISVEGYVTDDVDDYANLYVEINGENHNLESGGYFDQQVNLESGTNEIEVVAEDRAGNTGRDSVTVIRDDEDPSIEITQPEKESVTTTNDTIRMSGTVSDDVTESGNIRTSVDGVITGVSQDGSFGRSVSLEMGSNTIVITATDSVGNTSSEEIRVERVSETNWTLLAAMIALVAIILAILAVWKRRQMESEKGRGL